MINRRIMVVMAMCLPFMSSCGEDRPKGYGAVFAYNLFGIYYFDGYTDSRLDGTVNWIEGKGEAIIEKARVPGFPRILTTGHQDCIYEIFQFQRTGDGVYASEPDLVLSVNANLFNFDTAKIEAFNNGNGVAYRITVKTQEGAVKLFGSSIGDSFSTNIQPSDVPGVRSAEERAQGWLEGVKTFKEKYCSGLEG